MSGSAQSSDTLCRGDDVEPGPGCLKPVEMLLGGWQIIAIFAHLGNSPDQQGAWGHLFPVAPTSVGLAM